MAYSPQSDPAPDLTTQALAYADGVTRKVARRALVLARSGDRWAGPLSERGFAVTVQEDVSALGLPDGSMDVVLALEVLEHTEWDRWVLQQVHRVLKDGGRLVFAVPNRFALASPKDIWFQASAVLSQIQPRISRSPKSPTLPDPPAARGYRLSSLIETLKSLGYSVERRSAHAFGWLTPLARMRYDAVAGIAGTHLLLCERLPSLFGPDPRRPYPDPEAHRRRFEQARRSFIEDRERWLERYPRHRQRAAQPMDPVQYRGKRVVVLAPHPDDEIIGCGGTLAKLIAHRAHVTAIYATDGAQTASLLHAPPEVRRTVRLEEARAVGEAMGFASLVFWGEDNAAFRERDDLIERLGAALAEVQPALIFTPFPADGHRDHRILSRMLAKALVAKRDTVQEARVLSYGVWSLVPPNTYCDITDVVELQEQALLRYATAMKVKDYVHFCQDRNYYNACTLNGARGFYEVFFDMTARDYVSLVTTMERDRT